MAPSAYREVVINGAYHSGSYQGAFERLERSDAKVSRAVLRGRGGSNASLLPDRRAHIGGHTRLWWVLWWRLIRTSGAAADANRYANAIGASKHNKRMERQNRRINSLRSGIYATNLPLIRAALGGRAGWNALSFQKSFSTWV